MIRYCTHWPAAPLVYQPAVVHARAVCEAPSQATCEAPSQATQMHLVGVVPACLTVGGRTLARCEHCEKPFCNHMTC